MNKYFIVMSNKEIKVFAPASVANVACGYDVLGFALEKPGDEIIVRFTKNVGVHIKAITGTTKQLPLDAEKNTAGGAAIKLLEALGKLASVGIEMEIHKKMPFGSGLGSSAASAVAGAMAVNALLDNPFSKEDLLPFAVYGESLASGAIHADNIAPSLLGGFTLVRDSYTYDVVKLSTPKDLFACVVYPYIEILTAEARAILSPDVTLRKMVQQSANLGALVAALYMGDMGLLKRALCDVVIEPQRAKLIPHFYEVQKIALDNGALGCSISGSGPSLFALCESESIATQVGQKMQQVFLTNNIECELFVSPINQEGVKVIS
jgi:homoserine kinase